jgi:hypothetical protein
MCMAETVTTRVTRLENLVGVLAEKQIQIDDVLVTLTEAQIKTEERFEEVARQFQETDRRLKEMAQETDRRFQETDRRFQEMSREADRRARELDERIEKLVSAIGEALRRDRLAS